MGSECQVKKDEIFSKSCSKLLELSAEDDIIGFKDEVEEKGCNVNELSFWYGKRIGSKKMCFEERTPLLVAAMYGSIKVLKYIIETGKFDVNTAYGVDGATALHCAAAGGSELAVEIVKLLIEVAADINSVDANGHKPVDLVASCFKSFSNPRRKTLENLLKGIKEEEQGNANAESPKEEIEKKEYPVVVSMLDINKGMFATDEFRMYNFKVTPCSRSYSHDWTECPFVHPGENARRRDPKMYNYSCVPCPGFKKETCLKGDLCEYAHGVFESWLHPAQYRTRICKDDTKCARKVCFFAHRQEDLRPLYASTGSAMPTPARGSVSSMDIGSLSPMSLDSSSLWLPTNSSLPMSQSVMCSSPGWQNKINLPALQLPGSRLKANLSARDIHLETSILEERIRSLQLKRQHVIDEMTGLISPSAWNTEYSRMGDDVFGSPDSPKTATFSMPHLQSPTHIPMRRNANPQQASYSSNVYSASRNSHAAMNSRSHPFGNQSQSFNDHGMMSYHAAANSPTSMFPDMYDWGSPDGKIDWAFNTDEMTNLERSELFANSKASGIVPSAEEPDVSWVHSLVKDVTQEAAWSKKHGSILGKMPSWIDQPYIEQEQLVA